MNAYDEIRRAAQQGLRSDPMNVHRASQVEATVVANLVAAFSVGDWSWQQVDVVVINSFDDLHDNYDIHPLAAARIVSAINHALPQTMKLTATTAGDGVVVEDARR